MSKQPLKLLVISDVVFDGSTDAFGLDTVDICSSNDTIQVGILRKGFKSTTSQWRALCVDSGCEENMST
jgi:hypothetical protein